MTEEKWQNVKEMIKDKFTVLEEKSEPIELKTGLNDFQKVGDKEVLIFDSPTGKIKLEYLIKPVVLDKIEHYSKRMGTSSQTEYILSTDEFSRRLDAYNWKNDSQDWQKITFDQFN